MSKHIEISVKIHPLYSEYVSELLLNDIGCSGTVLEERYFDDEQLVKTTIGPVKGYLWIDPENSFDFEKIKQFFAEKKEEFVQLNPEIKDLGSWDVEFLEIKEEEWAHNWKNYWHPQKIGEKIVICPSWEEYTQNENEIIITLDPGSAFGTGTHSTTRLCIMALEKYLAQNDTIADIGTGSGILAISAIKLGAKSAVGVDNDPSVIAVAQDNATINNVDSFCTFYTGSAADVTGEYKVVTANILAHILIDIMHDLHKIVETDGKLILSGIIKQKEQDVIDSAQQHGFKYIETLNEENWVAIIVQK